MSDSHKPAGGIFDAALQLAEDQRAAYLDEACAGDSLLRQRVEALLRAHEGAGSFMDSPAQGPIPETIALSLPLSEKPGDKIGRYKLLQQIGEGGCGVVYMAEQEEPIRRKVALKVIKLGMDTRTVIARFEAERQALALMDHPNIAKVLDAGATGTGRPYFVMELVRGIKITDFCDQNGLSTRERLALFTQVCGAIQHAHQKGIIHGDIKPSNILVTINDGVAVPKVIDFGIAKATQGRLTDQTLFTAFEQFLGTPAYMSPEQAVMTSLDTDTRSDIYSLGVLLYELLTGKTPFEQKELLAAGLDEMRRTIKEKEPPKPSTRLSAMAGDELTTTAHRRQTEPPKLIHTVRGDLDWIVMKCLEKERGRRYETASGLNRDIERYLKQEPITARPPSRLYEFRKNLQRHKFGFGATAMLIAVLMAGIVVSTREAIRTRRAEQEQTRLRETAQKETELIKGMLKTALPQRGAGTNDELNLAILDQLQNAPETEAELRAAVADAYAEIGRYDDASLMRERVTLLQRRLEAPDNFTALQRATDAVVYGAEALVSAGLAAVIAVSFRRRLRLFTFVFVPLSVWTMVTGLEVLLSRTALWLLGCSLLGLALGAVGMIFYWRGSSLREAKRDHFPVNPWLDTLAGLGFLAMLIGLFYIIEDWRGKRAWENCKREYGTEGFALDWNQHIPPPVPDDENFFKAPKMAGWFIRQDSSNSSNSMPIRASSFDPESRITNQVLARQDLEWSGQFEQDFDSIREALKRPAARMDGDYSLAARIPIVNFLAVRLAVQAVAQRAHCHFLLKQPEQALDDLTLLRDLCHHVLEFPPSGKTMTLPTAMIDVASTRLYAEEIAEGLRLHVWQGPQLSVLQTQLQEINLPPLVHAARQSEALTTSQFFEIASGNDEKLLQIIRGHNSWTWKDLNTPLFWVLEISPRGWVYQNMAVNSDLQLKSVKSEFNPLTGLITAHEADKFKRAFDAFLANRHRSGFGSFGSPFRVLVVIAMVNFTKSWQATGKSQTMVNEAQIACALERYRLAHAKYPETLGALAPQFIEKIPHDIIGGQPLKYRRTADGKFRLYSVGWNETDDGGKDGGSDLSKGDWVWNN
jgi:serine/threonine protein kinase